MQSFSLDIITPQRQAFSEKVDSVYVPTINGEIGILAHHIPLFTSLTDGEIKIVSGTKEYFLAIGGGFMEVRPDGVSILVSRAVHADEINEAEIKKAIQYAKEALSRKAKGTELHDAQAILRRSLVEMKVHGHRSRSRNRQNPS